MASIPPRANAFLSRMPDGVHRTFLLSVVLLLVGGLVAFAWHTFSPAAGSSLVLRAVAVGLELASVGLFVCSIRAMIRRG